MAIQNVKSRIYFDHLSNSIHLDQSMFIYYVTRTLFGNTANESVNFVDCWYTNQAPLWLQGIELTKIPLQKIYFEVWWRIELTWKFAENSPWKVVENITFDDIRNFGSSLTSMVDVQGDDGHGACERHQANGHAVVQT